MTRREDIIPLVRDTIREAQVKLSQAEALMRENGFPQNAEDFSTIAKQCQVWTGPNGRLHFLEQPDHSEEPT